MQDDHLRIADTLLEISGVRYVITTVYQWETKFIASTLMVASAIKKDIKKTA